MKNGTLKSDELEFLVFAKLVRRENSKFLWQKRTKVKDMLVVVVVMMMMMMMMMMMIMMPGMSIIKLHVEKNSTDFSVSDINAP